MFSVPSFGALSGPTASEWFWWYWKGEHSKAYADFMQESYPPHFQYADFAPLFKAEFFNASEWADLFQVNILC